MGVFFLSSIIPQRSSFIMSIDSIPYFLTILLILLDKRGQRIILFSSIQRGEIDLGSLRKREEILFSLSVMLFTQPEIPFPKRPIKANLSLSNFPPFNYF